LTAEILNERELEYYVASWTLVPSSGGVFEVVVNGELIFSKKALGRHAEPGEVMTAFRDFLQTTLADRTNSGQAD
jgi:selenoprotein W-related protein